MTSGSIQLQSKKDLYFGDVQYNEEKHNPICSLTLWYRELSCVFMHLSYIFGETVFHLDLEIELIYNILLILSHTSLPRKPWLPLWPITIIYPGLLSVPVLQDWYSCPYSVYQGHMIMITINGILTLHKGQDVNSISSLEKNTIDY